MMTREGSASLEAQAKGGMSNEGYSFSAQMSPDTSELFPLSELNMGRLDATAFTIPAAVKQETAFQNPFKMQTPLKSTAAIPPPNHYQRSYSMSAIGIDPKELIYVKDTATNQI